LKYILQFLTVLAALLPCGLEATVLARRRAPNVILITIDTVRADHLGCYGATNVKTPTLDGLARDGIVFERAISQVPLTWPSHAAILTGTYPFQNGVQDFTGQPLDQRFRSVAQIFKQQGYTTGAVVSAFVLDRSWGLARGFDDYDDAFSAEVFRHKDIGLVDRKAGESVTRAISWLRKTPRRPFFFWLHLYDPHSPYDPPEPFRTLYKGHLYDGEIAYADHELGRLIGWLKQNQLYDRTAIVLLSDHGESLGDHGEKEHGFFVYNSTVHIPLIVKPPTGSGFRPGRVARPVETVAVAPTLTRLAGMKNEIQKQFSSPGLLSDSAENDTASYSESFYSFSSFGWSPLHALQTSRYHYIEAPTPELYDVIADPQEKNNLASQQTATVAVLEDKLQSLLQHNPFKLAGSGNSGLSPEALEKLRALGYVAYRSPVSPEALAAGLPDPKSKLWEFNAILDAGDAFHAGDFPTGEALLARVQEKDPQMSAVPYMLGEAALRQQKWDQAAAELQKSLELDSNFDQAMTALARALHEKGDDAGARQWLEKALQRNSQNFRAWYELGWLQARTGNNQDAQAAYEKVLAIQPNFALAQRDLGLIYFDRKDYQHATPYLLQATQLGLKEARVFNFLGICYDRTGRLSRAVQSYRQALQLDANLAEVHLNLGYAYEQLNRKSLAAQEYGKTCRLSVDLCRLIQRQKR
jgi:choline-sulfatase